MLHFSKQPIRFRRFAHKAYAAFASMHREVTIGHVGRAVADLEMLKAGVVVSVLSLMMLPGTVSAQSDSIREGLTAEEFARQLSLQEVLVEAQKTEETARSYRQITSISADDLRSLPVCQLADILTYLPGIDVRVRGAQGSQADVSMRGGTFDQVRVLLNGIDLSDAHTGHYALNLPVSAALIDRIEVLDGAINVITRTTPVDQPAIEADVRLTAGMNALVNPELALLKQVRDWKFSASAEYNHAGAVRVPEASEKEQLAADNSGYDMANLYFRASGVVDLQLGAQYKDAGAGMFYGFGSQTQRDRTHTGFLSLSHTHRWGTWSLDAKAAYRANMDYYQWWRTEPTKGANKHLTQNAHAELAAHYASWLGTTTVGLRARYEHIFSTNLGDSTAHPITIGGRELPLSGGRADLNYYLSQTIHYQWFTAAVRVDGHYNSVFGNHFGGNANLGFSYAKTGMAYFNFSHINRLPTFTDLYYNAGQQLGSRDLKPEALSTFAVGNRWRYTGQGTLSLEADAFYRLGRNIIDWVRTDDPVRPYHATNQNTVNSAGCEATVNYRLNDWLPCVRVSYAYTWLDLDLSKTGSRYLDYLSHKLTAHINHALYTCAGPKGWTLGAAWTLTYRIREGQYDRPLDTPDPTTGASTATCNFSPTLLLDGSLYFNYGRLRVAADCTNMTNRHYYDYGGILQPGAWLRGTISYRF